jgi:hypothetical protein
MEHFFKTEEPFSQGLKQKVLCMGGYRYPPRRRGFPPHGPAKLLLPFRGGTILDSLIQALREAGISEIVLVVAPGDRSRSGECGGIRVTSPSPGSGVVEVCCGLGGPSYLQEI